MPQASNLRKTARGIVVHDGKILMVERWRVDDAGRRLHYFSVPGGKIEPGETPEQTVVRELFEETSIVISVVERLAVQKLDGVGTHTYFLCKYISGSPALHPSATEAQLPTNRSKPCWLTLKQLEGAVLSDNYMPVRHIIIAAAKQGIAQEVASAR